MENTRAQHILCRFVFSCLDLSFVTLVSLEILQICYRQPAVPFLDTLCAGELILRAGKKATEVYLRTLEPANRTSGNVGVPQPIAL